MVRLSGLDGENSGAASGCRDGRWIARSGPVAAGAARRVRFASAAHAPRPASCLIAVWISPSEQSTRAAARWVPSKAERRLADPVPPHAPWRPLGPGRGGGDWSWSVMRLLAFKTGRPGGAWGEQVPGPQPGRLLGSDPSARVRSGHQYRRGWGRCRAMHSGRPLLRSASGSTE